MSLTPSIVMAVSTIFQRFSCAFNHFDGEKTKRNGFSGNGMTTIQQPYPMQGCKNIDEKKIHSNCWCCPLSTLSQAIAGLCGYFWWAKNMCQQLDCATRYCACFAFSLTSLDQWSFDDRSVTIQAELGYWCVQVIGRLGS